MRHVPRVFALLVPVFFSVFAPGASAKPPGKAGVKPQGTPKPLVAAPEAIAALDAPAPAPAVKLAVRREKLDNGLRVVLSPDPVSPTFAVDVVYDVGARNEAVGRSGFAHLFEHMMFQGSRNVAKGDHFRLVSAHGGSLNATTSEDRTNYFDLLPRSELPLALWLEADRMKSLDVSEKNFENQRSVVKEEFRMRVENAAYVPADIRLSELVFTGYFPYEHPAIGSMKDLDGAKLEWVRAFHDAYYAPNNAVLAIAGDIEPNEALELVRTYFGGAKAVTVPPYSPPPDPPLPPAREQHVKDVHAKLPGFFDGYRIPPRHTPEHYALELAAAVLGDGESSRLARLLVRERALCLSVEAGTSDHRGPDQFEVEARLARGARVDEVERLVDGEMAHLAEAPPTAAEMDRVKARIRSSFVLGLQSNFARAQRLAEFELYDGDADYVNSELDRYLAVTADQVRAAAAKHLGREHRQRVVVDPVEDEKPKPGRTSKEGGL